HEHGTNFTYPDPEGRYFLHDYTGDDFDTSIGKLKAYYDSGLDGHLQPIPGAVLALQKLSKKYHLAILSSQQLFQAEHTKQALIKEFGNLFRSMHFTASYNLGDIHVSKADVCKELGATYIIDDQLVNVTACAEAGVTAVLFGDYHWNQHDKLPK